MKSLYTGISTVGQSVGAASESYRSISSEDTL